MMQFIHYVYILNRGSDALERWSLDQIRLRVSKIDEFIAGKLSSIPFYVGIGQGNRLTEHENIVKSGKKSSNPYKDRIISSLLKSQGFVDSIKLVENISRRDAKIIEIALITAIGRRHENNGPLTNLTRGGDGALDPSPELRDKMSSAAKRRIRTLEYEVARIAASKTPEALAKKSASTRARPLESFATAVAAMQTPEAIAKREATKRDRGFTAWSPERRAVVAQRVAARAARKLAEREANRSQVIENRRNASNARWAKPGAHERASLAGRIRYANEQARSEFVAAMNRPATIAKLSAAAKRQFEDPAQLEANRQRGLMQFATEKARIVHGEAVRAGYARIRAYRETTEALLAYATELICPLK